VPELPYFAYGRNLGAELMATVCPGHRFLGTAELRDHRLAFRRRSVRTGTGVADVFPEPGHSVWGALYELDAQGLAALDEKEGNGMNYQRVPVLVTLADDAETKAFTYMVIEPVAHVTPSAEYLNGIVEEGRVLGFPEGYIEAVMRSAEGPEESL
jgi:gamma-glutamylcyclotransferase